MYILYVSKVGLVWEVWREAKSGKNWGKSYSEDES